MLDWSNDNTDDLERVVDQLKLHETAKVQLKYVLGKSHFV